MKTIKIILLILFVIGVSIFGVLNPNLYAQKDSLQYLISLNSIIYIFIMIETYPLFLKYIKDQNFTKLVIGVGWLNFYQVAILLATPLLLSIPLLISKELKLFVMLFSTCYFQGILMLTLIKHFYRPSDRNAWYVFTMLLLISVILFDKVSFGSILSLNPILTLSFIPYYFDFELTLLNFIISIGISYATAFVLYVIFKWKLNGVNHLSN